MARSHGRVPTHYVLLLLPDDLRARRKTNKQIKTQPYCACVRCNLATLYHCATLPGRSTWGSGTIDPQDRDRCFAFVWVLFVLEPRIRSLDAHPSSICLLLSSSSGIGGGGVAPGGVLCSQWPRGVEEAKFKTICIRSSRHQTFV